MKQEDIDRKGQAHLLGIPSEFKGKIVPIRVKAPGFEMSDPNQPATLFRKAGSRPAYTEPPAISAPRTATDAMTRIIGCSPSWSLLALLLSTSGVTS